MKKTFTGVLTLVAAGVIAISAAHAMNASAPTVQSEPQRAAVQTITPPYEEVWKTDQSHENLGSYYRYNALSAGAGFDYDVNENPQYSFGVICDTQTWKAGKDAWIITPPIQLQAGVKYDYSAWFGCYANDYETVEIYLGTQQTQSAMTTQLIDKTQITSKHAIADQELTKTFEVPTTGTYYIGVHAIVPAMNGFKLYFPKWSISAGVSKLTPGAPTEMKAMPGDDNNMLISLKAPSVTTGETALSNITKLEIYRDETLIRTFNTPNPGSAISYTDTEGAAGVHEYKAIAYNENGAGTEAKVKGFVGINTPAAPTNVEAVTTAKAGEVKLTWTAPAVDKDGYAINPDKVKYNIYNMAGDALVEVATGVSGNSYTYQAVPEDGEQAVFAYNVSAVTTAGESDKVGTSYSYTVSGDNLSSDPFVTSNLMVGPAYKVPYFESFANAHFSKVYDTREMKQANSSTVKAYWQASDYMYDPQDMDNGFVKMFGYIACWADYYSGRIDLAGTTNPEMTFWYAGIKADNKDQIKTFINDGTGYKLVKTTVCDEGEGEYHKVTVDLTPYAGKTINYMIRGYVAEGGFNEIVIDNIAVMQVYEKNYSIQSISAPATASFSSEIPVTISVRNTGKEEMPAFTIKLYRNGQEIGSTQWPAKTEPGQLVSRTFKDKISIEDESETLEYYAVIECADDQIASDNRSETVSVKVALNNYPTPRGAKAYRHVPGDDNNQDVKIEWWTPKREGVVPQATTDDFESYDSFAKADEDLGEWSVVDADGQPCYQLNPYYFPGIEDEVASFFIYDAAEASTARLNEPHSGDKMMASLRLNPMGTERKVDDWLISPKLSGLAQTVSFWAMSYRSEYLETFEVLASVKGKDLKDFKLIERVEGADFMWKEYKYDLPEGTMYFAIRRVSDNQVMLFVDDVTFAPSYDEDALVLEGYNVYRDGVKINKEPVRGSYIDKDAAKTYPNAQYAVSAVYNRGESRLSNKAGIDVTSVGAMGADEVSVEAGRGEIRVACAAEAPVVVYTIDGAVAYSGLGSANIPAQAGVYVVKAAAKTVKVIVK